MPRPLIPREGVPYTSERAALGRLIRKVEADRSRDVKWRLDLVSALQRADALLQEDEHRLRAKTLSSEPAEPSEGQSGSAQEGRGAS